MTKFNRGFIQYALLAIVSLIVVGLVLANSRKNSSDVDNSVSPTPSPTSIPPETAHPTVVNEKTPGAKPQTVKTPTPKPVTNSLLKENADKSMAFYYSAVQSDIDPFTVSYNADYLYNNVVVLPQIVFLKANDVVNAKINEVRTLSSLNLSRNDKQYTGARKWEDNSNLLAQTCSYGTTSECRYFLTNAIYNSTQTFAGAKLSNSTGFLSVSRLWDWFFVQSCPDGNPCDIKVFLIHDMADIPDSFDQYQATQTIQTTKYLVPYHAEEGDNDRNRASSALFHMSEVKPTNIDLYGDKGLLLFNIRTGEVHRQNL